mmetsp:Transcript_3773/g.7506  ORF Transcript_3773/g.7506 Transcript_3773/m.7506 type:complete len:298 (+) Transcript_3773:625-1518(+)
MLGLKGSHAFQEPIHFSVAKFTDTQSHVMIEALTHVSDCRRQNGRNQMINIVQDTVTNSFGTIKREGFYPQFEVPKVLDNRGRGTHVLNNPSQYSSGTIHNIKRISVHVLNTERQVLCIVQTHFFSKRQGCFKGIRGYPKCFGLLWFGKCIMDGGQNDDFAFGSTRLGTSRVGIKATDPILFRHGGSTQAFAVRDITGGCLAVWIHFVRVTHVPSVPTGNPTRPRINAAGHGIHFSCSFRLWILHPFNAQCIHYFDNSFFPLVGRHLQVQGAFGIGRSLPHLGASRSKGDTGRRGGI